jgi:hypothetical protein
MELFRVEIQLLLNYFSTPGTAFPAFSETDLWIHTAVSIKVVPEQSGKVEYERERMLGIANKFIKLMFYRFPAAFRARIRLFRFIRGQP